MELPILLPKELKYTSIATDDPILLNLLVKLPQDLIVFFESACEDETWSEKHPAFMRDIIQMLTTQFFEDRWQMSYAQRAAHAIRQHFNNLERLIPNNLTISYDKGGTSQVNSLLWGASSETLHILIRQECRDKRKMTLDFPDLPESIFALIQEFINTGNVKELWRLEEEELIPALQTASDWSLTSLAEVIQNILKKYIHLNNVCSKLIEAQDNRWFILRKECMNFINNLNAGIFLDPTLPELSFEFLDFRDKALSYFDQLREYIARLVVSRNLTEHPTFSIVINQCPRMSCLDISRSETFSDRFADIPQSLEELNVEKCAWLTNANLGKLLDMLPNLTKISLASNIQITYAGWSSLQKLRRLQKLDISRCHQITDEDFKLIMQAARIATYLSVQECKKLTDWAFQELGRNLPKLTDVDLSRCAISDVALSNLVAHCRQIVTLTLVRCPNLTEKGIIEAARNAPLLQRIDVSKCHVTPSIVDKINKIRPYLQVIF